MLIVKLVPYREEVLDLVMEWRRDAHTVRHNPMRSKSREEVGAMFAGAGSDFVGFDRTDYVWLVEEGGVPVGTIWVKDVNDFMGYAEVSYGVGARYRGRGLATEALRQVVDRTFRQTPLRKLIAYVHDENLASCRVLEKAGFVREGLLREHYLIHGVPVNEVVFGLLRGDWERANMPNG